MKLGDHRLTLLSFVLTLGVLSVMRGYFPPDLAIPLAGSEIRPVLLLEFASTPSHLVNIFGEAGDPQRAARIAGMTVGNRLDYLLMPSYGFLTLSFFFGIARETGGQFWRLFGWMGVAAAVSDGIENAIMLAMVDSFVAGTDVTWAMSALPYPVWIKFGLLSATCGGAAWAFFTMRRIWLAMICLPTPLLFVPGLLDPFGLAPITTSTIALGWIAMALHAATRLKATQPGPDEG